MEELIIDKGCDFISFKCYFSLAKTVLSYLQYLLSHMPQLFCQMNIILGAFTFDVTQLFGALF
jgi:hypothetical protein